MILHNDHSPRIDTGPANTRKHVFKISRAGATASNYLWPSLRTCARCVFRSPAGIAKELPRFSGNSFQVRIASRKLPSFQECRVHHDPTILSCANISDTRKSILIYSPRTTLCATYETNVAMRDVCQ